jgi:hypothetical protein
LEKSLKERTKEITILFRDTGKFIVGQAATEINQSEGLPGLRFFSFVFEQKKLSRSAI